MGLWTQFTENGNIWKGRFDTWRETNEMHLNACLQENNLEKQEIWHGMFARKQYRKEEIWKENHLQAIYIWDKKDNM